MQPAIRRPIKLSTAVIVTVDSGLRVESMRSVSMNPKFGPMPNVMVALPNRPIGGALCSTPQILSDAHY